MSGLLLRRVETLEAALSNCPGDAASLVSVLNGFRNALEESTSVQSLHESLSACNVYVEGCNNGEGDGGCRDGGGYEGDEGNELNFEERKTIVLAHYSQLNSLVKTAESVLTDYNDVLERFRSAVTTTPQLSLQLVLQEYKRIELKFIANVKRMLVLLEKYAILRYEKSKFISQ